MSEHFRNKPFQCEICQRGFTRKYDWLRHNRTHHAHQPIVYQCWICGLAYPTWNELNEHRQSHNASFGSFVERQRALHGAARSFECELDEKQAENDIFQVASDLHAELQQLLRTILSDGPHKISLLVIAECGKGNQLGEVDEKLSIPFRAHSFTAHVEDNLNPDLVRSFDTLAGKMEDFHEDGSCWKVERILSVRVEVIRCRPLAGSCNLPVVSKPEDLKKTQIPLNGHTSNDCFYRAIASHFVKDLDSEDVQLFIDLNMKRLHANDVQVEVREIERFERINPHLSLRINVLYVDGEDVIPIRASRQLEGKNIINLVLYKSLMGDKVIGHFALINSLDTFVRRTYRDAKGKKQYEKCHTCPNCLQKFSRVHTLDNHVKECIRNEPRKLEFPPEGEQLQFQHFVKKFKAPFIGFFDMESCATPPVKTCSIKSCLKTTCSHKSHFFREQKAMAYSLIILDHKYDIVLQRHYHGYDCIQDLQNTLVEARKRVNGIIANIVPMTLTNEETVQFECATTCHICEGKLKKKDNDHLVRDHCHLTGKFLGAAHNSCNLNRPERKLVHIYCHNFSGYDSHLILKQIKFDKDLKSIEGLAHNTEKLRTLKMYDFIFLDSLSFLQGSLAELVQDLAKSKAEFKVLNQMPFAQDKTKRELLLRKGVFPYEFATSIEALRDAKSMPAKEHFFNHLTDSGVTDVDYEHANRVFQEFSCSNRLDYTMLYMMLDTALLADVFIHFRETMHDKFQLDPCQYISLPGYAYDCMLKLTGIAIDYIRDPDLFLMLSQNIRGGFSFVAKRLETNLVESNTTIQNDRLVKTPARRKNLLYIDANNLYGWAQCQALPIGEFTFLSESEIQSLDLDQLTNEDDYGYIFEVDLEYPSSLHKQHRSFPLAPEKITVTPSMLSSYQLKCREKLNLKKPKSNKLSATFYDREKYVVHYSTLKLYVKLGLKIKKIYRVVKFRQSKFLKEYIDYCTSMRQTAATDFKKRLFKLMANCIYGKFIENTSKHLKVKFARSKTDLMKYASNPRFMNCMIISPDLVAVFLKTAVTKAKQAYGVGFSILDLSKEFMYRSYYEHIVKAFDGRCEVLMSDTDSLFISTPFCTNPFERLLPILDTSNFDPSHPLACLENKSRLGYFKSETGCKLVTRFIGLRSKCYAFETEGSNDTIKCKGVSRAFKDKIPVSNFEKCIKNIASVYVTQYGMQSKNHLIHIVRNSKLAFSSYDDKRYVLSCGVHTLPFGSVEIAANSLSCSFCD